MRRRVIRATVPCALLLAITLGVATPASASGGFTFYGSGDGHGIGMSQWGAYGLAKMGWTDDRIIQHFYRGTNVVTDASLPSQIRVGLTWDRTVVHLTAQVGQVRLWQGHAGGTLIGAIPAGDTWTVQARTHDWGIRRPNGKLVGRHGWGGPHTNLIVTYQDQGSRVFIPEADAIWYHGFSYKRGSIEMNLTSCGDANGCVERLIARLNFEDYLLGLGEVPASWPMAAMQAQAIAARSYAAYDMIHYPIRSDCNCDLTDGASDQTYIGNNREAGADGDRWVKAVRSTAHQVAMYGGKVIQAFYAASDGGHTDSVQDVWHGGNPAYKIPWLTGVCDPGEWTDANPWTDWSKSYTASDVTARLAPYTTSIGTIRRFRSIHRTGGGRIMSAVAVGTSGAHRVSGDELKSALGWYDDRVWVNSDHTIRGAIRHRYDSLGCKPGLPTSPQRVVQGGAGAQQFFADGGMYRNNGADLTLWLHGPIDQEFRAVGAATGVLGLPTSATTSVMSATKGVSCTGCRRLSFTGGRIYDGPSTGAHALWGNVLETYVNNGGAVGPLGMPTTRVQDRVGGGVRASFEHGTIACRAGTCHVTSG